MNNKHCEITRFDSVFTLATCEDQIEQENRRREEEERGDLSEAVAVI